MASSSAALKVAAACMLALFAVQLMMATPAAAEPGLQGLVKRRSLLATPAAVGSPVCVPDNCPICVPSKCPFCFPVCKKCVFCVQLCICDCNLETYQCSGFCYNNCMLRTDLD